MKGIPDIEKNYKNKPLPPKPKKDIVFFTVADAQNKVYAKMLKNSFDKFHQHDFRVYDEQFALERQISPNNFWYLSTPLIAKEIFAEGHEWVIKIDADSIITGDLDIVFSDPFFDVGTVYNWNRIDPKTYGEVSLLTIQPLEYFNNGFVVMHSKEFVDHWYKACKSVHFDRMPMREQGFLNILCHYAGFNVRCLDDFKFWFGLRSKGEWNRCIMKGNDMILPKGQDHYPMEDKIIRIIHWAGGAGGVKMNYRIYFQEECIKYLDWLVSDSKEAYGK
jgi:hypothetical protein